METFVCIYIGSIVIRGFALLVSYCIISANHFRIHLQSENSSYNFSILLSVVLYTVLYIRTSQL